MAWCWAVGNEGKVVAIAEAPGYLRREVLLPKSFDPHGPVLLTLQRNAAATPSRTTASPDFVPPRPAADASSTDSSDSRVDVEDQPRPPPVKSTGKVKFLAKPTAQIYIDGVDLGWTPLLNHSLPAGRHRVRLVRTKEPAYEKMLDLEVLPNQTVFRRYIHPVSTP